MSFVFQRQVPSRSSVIYWVDSKRFSTREQALAHCAMERRHQEARIRGRGGSGYTGEHVQPTRVIEILEA